MNALNVTQVMDRIGLTLVTAVLLAGLPIGVFTALANSI
jgi:hypothetical protein